MTYMQNTIWQDVFIQTHNYKKHFFCTWTLLIWRGCLAAHSIPTICN